MPWLELSVSDRQKLLFSWSFALRWWCWSLHHSSCHCACHLHWRARSSSWSAPSSRCLPRCTWSAFVSRLAGSPGFSACTTDVGRHQLGLFAYLQAVMSFALWKPSTAERSTCVASLQTALGIVFCTYSFQTSRWLAWQWKESECSRGMHLRPPSTSQFGWNWRSGRRKVRKSTTWQCAAEGRLTRTLGGRRTESCTFLSGIASKRRRMQRMCTRALRLRRSNSSWRS